ncbi:hypothetical protein CCR95_00180 [Thiocystis minor]|nr:hypothetical protein [Thiocystis minor]
MVAPGKGGVTVQVEVRPLKGAIPVRDAIAASLNDLDFIVEPFDASIGTTINQKVGVVSFLRKASTPSRYNLAT